MLLSVIWFVGMCGKGACYWDSTRKLPIHSFFLKFINKHEISQKIDIHLYKYVYIYLCMYVYRSLNFVQLIRLRQIHTPLTNHWNGTWNFSTATAKIFHKDLYSFHNKCSFCHPYDLELGTGDLDLGRRAESNDWTTSQQSKWWN